MNIEGWQRIRQLIQLRGILHRTTRASQAASAQFRTSLFCLLGPQFFGGCPRMLALKQQELEGPRIRHLVQHNVAALKRVITLLVLDTLLCGSKPPTALRASHFRSRLVRCMRKMQRRTDALRLCRAVSTITLPVMLPHTMLVPCLNNELEQRKAQLAELRRLPVLQGHIHGRSKKAFFGRHVAKKTPRARCPCT